MTSAQDKLYWRLWAAAARSNDWIQIKGRLVAVPEEPARSAEHAAIWAMAALIAADQSRAVTASDLRHACSSYAVLPQRRLDVSHLNLTNPQIDRLFSLFRLLADPDDLDARMKLDDPREGELERLKRRIRGAAPYAYIDRICRDRFENYQPPFWDDLPLNHLKILHHILRERTDNWSRKVGSAVETEDADACDCPF